MLSKSSIAFVLNPVSNDSDCRAVGRVVSALSVLARHRKRPALGAISESPGPGPQRTRPFSPLLTIDKTSEKTAPFRIPCRRLVLSSPLSSSPSNPATLICPLAAETATTKPRRKRVRVRSSVPCAHAGCGNVAVTMGVCVRHGGGARCEVAGCEKRAKKNKRCFTHGGCTQCQHDGCASKAKRYGFCWAHGGGKPCTVAGCDKVGGQGGLCWAHGGGSRCRVTHCTRRSYQKNRYLCAHHAVGINVHEHA